MKYNRIPENHIGEVGDMGVTTIRGVDYFIVKFPSGWGVLGGSQTIEQVRAASAITSVAAEVDVTTSKDFWASTQNTLTITGSSTTVTPTNTVVVSSDASGLPVGSIIDCVHILLKWRQTEDTSGLDNAIANASMSVQIDDDDNTGWLTAYIFTNGDCAVDIDTSNITGGDMREGITDIKSRVDAADTYDVQIINVQATGNNLILRDFQWGLRIWWH